MPIELGSLSRFNGTQPIVRNSKETFGLWSRPNELIPGNIDENKIISISIDQRLAGRPDIIASERYGSPLLEWIVVMFNRPLNTVGWPFVGSIIRIPAPSVVRRII